MDSEDQKQGVSPSSGDNSEETNKLADSTPDTGETPSGAEPPSAGDADNPDQSEGQEIPAPPETSPSAEDADAGAEAETSAPAGQTEEDEQAGDGLYDPYDYGDDPYGYDGEGAVDQPAADESQVAKTGTKAEEPPSPPPPPPAADEDDEEDDNGMLRMSFMEHLEELRSRILKMLAGVGVAFLASIIFANDLWLVVQEPAADALRSLGVDPPKLAQIKPMEVFTTVWVKLPILAAIFLSSPWILYQVWAFIAPGLYKRERRWAAPFVICSAGLFILGGAFAYFVAFRFGLTFLLGIGRNINITPVVSITEYFDLFVNVTLGIGLVFELPVLIFFLTLLRIVTPGFLVRNSRYAVLVIVILAAIITPTPDVVNLMLFAVPMCLLYFVGVFAGYILNLHRDNKRFPWGILLLILVVFAAIVATAGYLAVTRYGFEIQSSWPFFSR